MKPALVYFLFFVALCGSPLLLAQTDSNQVKVPGEMEVMAMTLEELMNMTISLATKTSIKQEEAPSIVTVLSKKEISTYGARDIADVLRMVPGFEFGVDVNQIIGLSFRGIWAHEGKCLIMINGIMVNDMGYGNMNFFGNIPVSMIERIEIIRGPGSPLYGGLAEVAVVNIITDKGGNLNGLRAVGDIGAMGDGVITRNATFSVGYKGADYEISAHLGSGFNVQSTKTYTPFITTKTVDYSTQTLASQQMNAENAYRKPFFFIFDAKIKNLDFQYLKNSFTYSAQNNWFIAPKFRDRFYSEERNHTVQGLRASYSWEPGHSILVQPLLEYINSGIIAGILNPQFSRQGQWRNPSIDLNHYKGEVTVGFSNELLLGAGYALDYVFARGSDGQKGLQLSSDPNDLADETHTYSGYLMGQYTDHISDLDNLGITVGARYEMTSFGNAIAPRIGLTYGFEKLNFKLLYGRSYRVPLPFQAFSRAMTYKAKMPVPETCHSFEFETGYRIASSINAKLNVFCSEISDPLVYLGGTIDGYKNFGDFITAGFEGEFKAMFEDYGVFFNLSFAKPLSGTSAMFTTVDEKSFIGIADWKFNGGFYYNTNSFTFSPSFTYISNRSGVTKEYAVAVFNADNPDAVPFENEKHDGVFLLNLNLKYSNVFEKFDISVAGYNLLDSDYLLIQPYYDTYAPIPANDRHFVLTIVWRY